MQNLKLLQNYSLYYKLQNYTMTLFYFALFLLLVTICQADTFSDLKEKNKKLLAEAIQTYSEAKENVARRETVLVDTIKNIQAAMEQIGSALPEAVIYDRFYEGYKNVTLVAETLITINPFVVNVVDGYQRKMGFYGQQVFNDCYNREVASSLKLIIDALPQKLAKLDEAESGFKKQLERCSLPSVVRAGTTLKCIGIALNLSIYPTVPETSEQTIQSMQKLLKCLAYASERSIVRANTGIEVYKASFKDYQLAIVNKYDSDGTPAIEFTPVNKLLPISKDILNKLEIVKGKVAAAKVIQKQAAEVKNITLNDAKAALKPQLKDLEDFVSQMQPVASSEEQNCYSAAADFLNAGLNKRAEDLVNCITSSGIVPSAIAIATVDNNVRDTEAKQYTLWPAVECSKNVRNIFYPSRMEPCLATAKEDTLLQLSTIQLLMENAAEDSANFLVLAKRCKCNIETKLRREARDAFYTLQTCISTATKLRFEIPQQPCVLTACA